MTGFEPQTSGVGRDCSINWATTTAPIASIVMIKSNTISITSVSRPILHFCRMKLKRSQNIVIITYT